MAESSKPIDKGLLKPTTPSNRRAQVIAKGKLRRMAEVVMFEKICDDRI